MQRGWNKNTPWPSRDSMAAASLASFHSCWYHQFDSLADAPRQHFGAHAGTCHGGRSVVTARLANDRRPMPVAPVASVAMGDQHDQHEGGDGNGTRPRDGVVVMHFFRNVGGGGGGQAGGDARCGQRASTYAPNVQTSGSTDGAIHRQAGTRRAEAGRGALPRTPLRAPVVRESRGRYGPPERRRVFQRRRAPKRAPPRPSRHQHLPPEPPSAGV